MSAIKSRNWCFTVNNYSDVDENLFKEANCKYMVYGREVGAEGTPHLQGFIVFENAKHLGGVKTLHASAHWEIAKGNCEQNRIYCTKQLDFVETGVIPMSQKRKGEVEIERWDDAWNAAKRNRIDDIPADIRFRFYTTFKLIAKDYMVKPDDLEVMDNEWVFGPPGFGKSRYARVACPDAYFKGCNKWWDGYQDQTSVIIDDFELDGKCLGHHLKIWGDRYAFNAESKGSAMLIRPKKIIVTSNYSIEEVFAADQTMVQAILRRFKQIHVSAPLEFALPEPAPVHVVEDLIDNSDHENEEVDFGIWGEITELEI